MGVTESKLQPAPLWWKLASNHSEEALCSLIMYLAICSSLALPPEESCAGFGRAASTARRLRFHAFALGEHFCGVCGPF